MKIATLMQHAYLVGQSSKCVSWKVGAVIAKDGRIISTGYNGTPAGREHVNCCEHATASGWLKSVQHGDKVIVGLNPEFREAHSKWSSDNEIHAELNAILYAAKTGQGIDGATMYVTVSPCPQCAKAIAQSGIKTVIYQELYDKNPAGWEDILLKSGIKVMQNKAPLNFIDFNKVFSNQSIKNQEKIHGL